MTQKTRGIEWWKYYYDFENRLMKVEYFDGTQTTIYIYLGWNIIFEKESSTMTETKHVFGPNGHVAKIVGQTKYFYHSDHLGSLRQETDEAGNTLWSSPAQYEPFGEMRSGGPEQDGYFYTGKLRDASTGLYYYGNRFYDPGQARFLTKHILSGSSGNSQSWNPYIYTLNNPLKYTDPTGNDEEDIPVGVSYVTSKSGRVLRVLGAGGPTDVSGSDMWDRDGTIVKLVPNNTRTNPSSTVNPTPAPAPAATPTPTSNPNPAITGDPSYYNGVVTWPTSTASGPVGAELPPISEARLRAYVHRDIGPALEEANEELNKAAAALLFEFFIALASAWTIAALTPVPADDLVLMTVAGGVVAAYELRQYAILVLLATSIFTLKTMESYNYWSEQVAWLQAWWNE